MKIKKHLSKIILILYFLVLIFNFKTNFLNLVSNNLFESFQKDTESMIIGRLIQSEEEGIFSKSCFLGWHIPVKEARVVVED